MALGIYSAVKAKEGVTDPSMENILDLYNERALRGFVMVNIFSTYYPYVPFTIEKEKPHLAEMARDYIRRFVLPRE